MLDPSSAIGLAASLVTLIGFTKDVLSKSQELHRSINGDLVQNTELRAVMERFGDCMLQFRNTTLCKRKYFENLGEGFDSDTNGVDQFEVQLLKMAEDVGVIIDQLMQALQKLAVSSPESKWSCARQALTTVFKEPELREFEERIDRYRKQIDTTLLLSLQLVNQHVPPSHVLIQSSSHYVRHAEGYTSWLTRY